MLRRFRGSVLRMLTAVLKPLRKPDRQSSRQQLHRKRDGAGGAPIPHCGAQYPAGDDVGLPVRLTFEPRKGVIRRQDIESPNPGLLSAVVRDERRHEARLQSDLAAWETLIAASLEPCIRIVSLVWTCAAEAVLQNGRADSGDRRCIDRLPEGVTQFVIVAEPQTAGHFKGDDAVLESRLILARPDAVLIERQFMIEPCMSVARCQSQQEQQARPSGRATRR
jgi:hypothetical protein